VSTRPCAPPPPIDTEPVAAPVPESVQLGAVAVGPTADAQVVVTGVGAANLAVGAIRIAGPKRRGLRSRREHLRRGVAARGRRFTITVRFRPTAPGSRAAQLVVADDAVETPLRIELAGTGS
jgi:hypothetical protein